MSTKIFYAYRLSKPANLIELLREFTEIAEESVATNEGYLKAIHRAVILKAWEDYTLHKTLQDSTLEDDPQFKKKFELGYRILNDYLEGETHYSFDYYMKCELESAASNVYSRIGTDMLLTRVTPDFKVSIGEDDDYYYLKFFPNNVYIDVMSQIVEKYPQLEDFHFQNQTDPPIDIPYDDYLKRDEKWEELTGPVHSYVRMMSYDIFTTHEFMDLFTKQYYTGTPDLYDHLAYQFNDYTIIRKKKESDENN